MRLRALRAAVIGEAVKGDVKPPPPRKGGGDQPRER